MRQILVASGKGGTGKTSITAALAEISGKIVLADLDVDASNLPFLASHNIIEKHDFYSGHEATISQNKCIGCGKCKTLCKFDAIDQQADTHNPATYSIISQNCEGCGVCAHFCPAQAITLAPRNCGQWFVSHSATGPLVHAELSAAGENSGRLVAVLRKKAVSLAQQHAIDTILADGAPGIGCPVISGITGMDYALLVTESSPAGLHDLQRIHALCAHFGVSCGVIINKADINPDITGQIENFCHANKVDILGQIPFYDGFSSAMHRKKTVLGENKNIDTILYQIHNRLFACCADNSL